MDILNKDKRNIFNVINSEYAISGTLVGGTSVPYMDLKTRLKAMTLDKLLSRREDEHVLSSNNNFREYIPKIRKIFKLTNLQIAEGANISEAFLKDIINGKCKQPSRDTIIGLCFGCGLNVDESNLFLLKAGHNEFFYRDRRDRILLKCIDESMDIYDVNEILIGEGLDKIGNYDER